MTANMRVLFDYANHLGCPVRFGKWPGEAHAPKAHEDHFVAHEIAHWLIATERQRKLPWYGLRNPKGEQFPNRYELYVESAAHVLETLILLEHRCIKSVSPDHDIFGSLSEYLPLLERRGVMNDDRRRTARRFAAWVDAYERSEPRMPFPDQIPETRIRVLESLLDWRWRQ